MFTNRRTIRPYLIHTATAALLGLPLAVAGVAAPASAALPGTCNGLQITIQAVPGVPVNAGGGNDVIGGTQGNDIINGGGGDDTICGWGGDDIIDGDNGHDWVSGGDDVDEVDGSDGNDILYGNDGNDEIDGGNDDDTLRGGDGTDWLRGGADDDLLHCGGGGGDLGDGGPHVNGDVLSVTHGCEVVANVP